MGKRTEFVWQFRLWHEFTQMKETIGKLNAQVFMAHNDVGHDVGGGRGDRAQSARSGVRMAAAWVRGAGLAQAGQGVRRARRGRELRTAWPGIEQSKGKEEIKERKKEKGKKEEKREKNKEKGKNKWAE